MNEYFTQTYATRQAELEQAKAVFFAAGGNVVIVTAAVARPEISTVDDPAVVAKIREYRHLGVVAAGRATQLSTRTVHKIAKRNGVEFSTDTGEKLESRRKDLGPKIRRMAAQGLSQRKIARALRVGRYVVNSVAQAEGIELPNGGTP